MYIEKLIEFYLWILEILIYLDSKSINKFVLKIVTKNLGSDV